MFCVYDWLQTTLDLEMRELKNGQGVTACYELPDEEGVPDQLLRLEFTNNTYAVVSCSGQPDIFFDFTLYGEDGKVIASGSAPDFDTIRKDLIRLTAPSDSD